MGERVIYLKVSREKLFGLTAQKMKAAYPVNYFPFPVLGGKNIKNFPPSKLFLYLPASEAFVKPPG